MEKFNRRVGNKLEKIFPKKINKSKMTRGNVEMGRILEPCQGVTTSNRNSRGKGGKEIIK